MLHERLVRKLNQRPPSKWAVVLPEDYPWKALSAALADIRQLQTRYQFSELDQIVRSRDLAKYLQWGKQWTLQSMSSAEEVELSEWRIGYFLASIIKKYQFPGDLQPRKDAGISLFKQTDAQCSTYNTVGYKQQVTSRLFQNMEEKVRERIAKIIGDLKPESELLMKRARHGPGSSSNSTKGRVSQYNKYSEWPYHVTKEAFLHARDMITQDERWYGALEQSYRAKFSIDPWCILDQDVFWSEVLTVVDGNRITTVPKDALIERPIAIEPTCNLMLQLGVDGFIRRQLKRWGIDLNTQETNQFLAYEGSLRKDYRSPSTIDMKSASDTISLRTCKSLLPKDWFEYLADIRSPKGSLPDGTVLRFSKMSTMGNGYTFALESLIFVAIGMIATESTLSGVSRPLAEVHIHGDDLIVPECASFLAVMLLEAFGFVINTDKSFMSGCVKESCGMDWYQGCNMRPVFLKVKPHNPMGLLADRNRIVRWLSLTFNGGYVCHTPNIDALYLQKWGDTHTSLMVGPVSDSEFDTYVHSAVEPRFVCTDQRFYFSGYSCRLREVKCNDFHFRKLMHSLTPSGPPLTYEEGPTTTKAGSRFTVTRREIRPQISVINRISWEWNVAYRTSMPTAPSNKGDADRY